MAGAVDEDVFERGFAHAHCLNFSGKRLDHAGDEAVAVFHLDAHLVAPSVVVEDRGVDVETRADALRKRLGIVGGVEQDDIAAD
jgi:hypothetical protein